MAAALSPINSSIVENRVSSNTILIKDYKMVLYKASYKVDIDVKDVNAQKLSEIIEEAQDYFSKNHNSADLEEMQVLFGDDYIEFEYEVHA